MTGKPKAAQTTKKITKYAVDWVAFDKAAQGRGAYRLTVEREAAPAVQPEPMTVRPGRGRQLKYSDETVHSMLMLALASRMSLREVEGYVRALRDEADYDWDVPDHSTLCRRMRRLQMTLPPVKPGAKLFFLVDSTGLKLSGPGEWRGRHAHSGKEESKASKPAASAEREFCGPPRPAEPVPDKLRRRDWRKAHLAVEYFSGLIVAASLTEGTSDDAQQMPRLLDEQPLAGAFVNADGAYTKPRSSTTYTAAAPSSWRARRTTPISGQTGKTRRASPGATYKLPNAMRLAKRPGPSARATADARSSRRTTRASSFTPAARCAAAMSKASASS